MWMSVRQCVSHTSLYLPNNHILDPFACNVLMLPAVAFPYMF